MSHHRFIRNAAIENRVTAGKKKIFIDLYNKEMTYDEIVNVLGHHKTTWMKIRSELGLPPRKKGGNPVEKRTKYRKNTKGELREVKEYPSEPSEKVNNMWTNINCKKWGKMNFRRFHYA